MKKNSDSEIQYHLSRAIESNKFMQGIVSDLLDFNLISNDKFSLKEEYFELKPLIDKILSIFEHSIEEKNLVMSLEFYPLRKLIIYADQKRLERVLMNLLSNAIKFTLKGSICLMIKKNGNILTFAVSDTGIGIKEEDKPKIFKMYGSIKNSENNINSNGIGLGLTISNDIIMLMNGNDKQKGIKMESQYNVGSKFWFELPLKRNNSTNISIFEEEVKFENNQEYQDILNYPDFIKNQENDHENNPFMEEISYEYDNVECLIIEDEITNITILKQILSLNNIIFDFAFNGKEAIQKVEEKLQGKRCFKLILSDINMPVMNGLEFIQEFQKLMKVYKCKKKTFVLACSAISSIDEKNFLQKYKFDEIIEKPLNQQKISKVREKYLI